MDLCRCCKWIYRKIFSYIEQVRKKHSNSIIVAGNVCTPEATEQLVLAGADVVKIGIGPGSVCTTRKMTGVGYPQLSCIIECADAAHGLGGHVMSDGGCTVPGDVAKAFGAGADFVMLGGMLAGHDECRGEIEDGSMVFYGSLLKKHNSSITEKNNHIVQVKVNLFTFPIVVQ